MVLLKLKILDKKQHRTAQNSTFTEERVFTGSLNNEKVAEIKQNNKLNSPDPFVAEEKGLCLGSRLKNSTFNSKLHTYYFITQN